jgi:hypothetical protein
VLSNCFVLLAAQGMGCEPHDCCLRTQVFQDEWLSNGGRLPPLRRWCEQASDDGKEFNPVGFGSLSRAEQNGALTGLKQQVGDCYCLMVPGVLLAKVVQGAAGCALLLRWFFPHVKVDSTLQGEVIVAVSS